MRDGQPITGPEGSLGVWSAICFTEGGLRQTARAPAQISIWMVAPLSAQVMVLAYEENVG
jgi:hypothetical protein